MNSRLTMFFFAALLTMLWVFGLMIAHKKTALDQTLVMPSLQKPDVKIDKVSIKTAGQNKEAVEMQFARIGEHWFLEAANQKVRVQDFHIKNIIDAIKEVKHDDAADVSKDLEHYGLTYPHVTVTLFGKIKDDAKEWQFFVGKESPDKSLFYVSSSDRPSKAFAAPKRSLESLVVKDPNHFRAKRLFDFIESSVSGVRLQKADEELELTRGDNNLWTIVKPPLGFAGFYSETEDKKKDDKLPPKETKDPQGIDSVKSLLDTVVKVVVEDEADFVPLGEPLKNYGLETDKAPMRIDIKTLDEKKALTTDTLLVGNKVPDRKGEYYYARLASDDGVMRINAKWFDPLEKFLKTPGKIRSLDVSAFDKKQVDAVILKRGSTDETQFFKLEDKPSLSEHWQMVHGGEKKKANDGAVDALIELVLGKRAIVSFHDGIEADLKKKEEEMWGLGKSATEIAIYVNGIDKDKKEEKKDEKKDEKKGDKKDDVKDEKKGDKKDDKKEPLPTLKKDSKGEVTKPEVTLAIGKIEGDIVHIRRTLKDGTVTRFTMKKEIAEKAQPPEGVELAYLDTALPTFSPADVVSLRIKRTTDKGTDVLELEHRGAQGEMLWFIKGKDAAKLANSKATDSLVGMLSGLHVQKWLKKLGEKEDLDKLGLKPVATATITVKKQSDFAAASLFGALGGQQSFIEAVCGAVARRQADTGEVITIEFGKETDDEKDKPGVFATHSGSKLLFLAPPGIVKMILKEDLHDRSSILFTQVEIVKMLMANAAVNPISQMMFASPYFTGTVHNLDPEKVTKVRLAVRTPYELRKFSFERIAKMEEANATEKTKEKGNEDKIKDDKAKGDKTKVEKTKDDKAKDDKTKDKEKSKETEKVSKWTWIDKSTGLDEFKLDPDKVAKLVKDFAKLHTDRFVTIAGGPRDEQKLDPKEAVLKLEFDMEDGKTITLLVGASYLQFGHFAASSLWVGPDGKMAAVFFIRSSAVDPILGGASFFAKERSAAD